MTTQEIKRYNQHKRDHINSLVYEYRYLKKYRPIINVELYNKRIKDILLTIKELSRWK